MKFRRKTSTAAEVAESEAVAAREPGPWDSADVREDGVERVDLGALLLPPLEGLEVRLQVDEKSGNVRSVLLAGPEGAVELQVFAAPRNGDLWGTVRPQIAEDLTRRGAEHSEREGRWGTELVCQLPVQRPDGTPAVQPSRIVGVNGPRWLLRATFMGVPATDPEKAGEWEDALSQVVVHRGDGAMPVGEQLPVVLPADARRVR
ncbi:MAG: DUF3710 domain-containing protein [Nocardioides sp.]|uniref:DUF3710 domain-containing protein n=1 Tax=Nocardioides sp. TaxID=35761 RepID=UPI003EFFAF78